MARKVTPEQHVFLEDTSERGTEDGRIGVGWLRIPRVGYITGRQIRTLATPIAERMERASRSLGFRVRCSSGEHGPQRGTGLDLVSHLIEHDATLRVHDVTGRSVRGQTGIKRSLDPGVHAQLTITAQGDVAPGQITQAMSEAVDNANATFERNKAEQPRRTIAARIKGFFSG